MLRKIYLSKLGYLISKILSFISIVHKPFMVYGFINPIDKKFKQHTRISSSCKLVNKENIDINNNVWIGHYCLIDGIGGVKIEKGVHLASHTVIYSHSSQDAIRLLGKHYIEIPVKDRIGYIFDDVLVGEYSFIGTSCVILPGTKIGKGCVVGAGSIVKGQFPDFSIIVGNPAKIVGDTRKVDKKYKDIESLTETYYNKDVLKKIKNEGFTDANSVS